MISNHPVLIRTVKVALAVAGLLTIGTLGYAFIEGWSFFDALYMTVITITTTGYQEVHSLTPAGRAFTIAFLLLGIGAAAAITQNFVENVLSVDPKVRRRKAMMQEIDKLSNHVILCGFGRMGKAIAKELSDHRVQFVAVDPNPQNFDDSTASKYPYIVDDAAKDEVLLKAGVKRAKALLCMVNSDAESLYITLGARALNDNLYIISRAEVESARVKILRAGANEVILPVFVSALKVANSVISQHFEIIKNLNEVLSTRHGHIEFQEVPVDEKNALAGKTIANCGVPRRDMIIIGVKQRNGDFLFAPKSDYEFKPDDVIVTVRSQSPDTTAT